MVSRSEADTSKSCQTNRKRWLQPLTTMAIAGIALMGVIAIQRAQLNRPSLWVSNPKQAEQEEKLRLQLLKRSPTFGFDNLMADWAFLNFLQYYGDNPARAQTGYTLSADFFDVITQRDPRFVESYLFLSGSVSYQSGNPDLAIQFMKRGTDALSPQINPKSFLVWRFKGLDQLLLVGDVPGAIYSHEMAAKWAKDTPDNDLVGLFQATADFLRRDPNSAPIRFQSWISVYYQALAANDKQTQERAKREIVAMGGQVQTKDGKVDFVMPKPQPQPSRSP